MYVLNMCFSKEYVMAEKIWDANPSTTWITMMVGWLWNTPSESQPWEQGLLQIGKRRLKYTAYEQSVKGSSLKNS